MSAETDARSRGVPPEPGGSPSDGWKLFLGFVLIACAVVAMLLGTGIIPVGKP